MEKQHFVRLHVEDRICLNCGWHYSAHRPNLECPVQEPQPVQDPQKEWPKEES